jgi:small subunit ribosomal protein S8
VDTLANALNSIKVAEHAGRAEARISPASKLVRETLEILKTEGYLADYSTTTQPGSEARVKLAGKINDCGAIKPRFYVRNNEWEKHEQRYLPSKDVGLLIVTTSKGVMTHKKAKELGTGGKLLAFVY